MMKFSNKIFLLKTFFLIFFIIILFFLAYLNFSLNKKIYNEGNIFFTIDTGESISKTLSKLLTNAPVMLMYEGEILYENLEKTNVGEDDLIAKLREANALNFSEVKAVILESTGDMSVLHSKDDSNLEDRILKGVKGLPIQARLN